MRWKERNFNADAYVTFSLNPDGSIERMKMSADVDRDRLQLRLRRPDVHAGEGGGEVSAGRARAARRRPAARIGPAAPLRRRGAERLVLDRQRGQRLAEAARRQRIRVVAALLARRVADAGEAARPGRR